MTGTLSPRQTEEPMLGTVRQVADRLSVSRSSVYLLMDSGRLPYIKLGRSRRVRWDDVLKLIESHTVHGDVSRT